MVYLVLNSVEVTSKEQLEQLIVDLPEESKAALRALFDAMAAQLKGQ